MALPFIVYLTNPLTLVGAVLPAVFSGILFLPFWRQAKDQRLIIAFLLFAVTIGLATQYWGVLGLHLFTGSLIVWPILALLQGDNFPWPLAYPLAFISTVLPDMYGAGMAGTGKAGWYFGVGGAGLHDGLFLVPLETLIAAAALNRFGVFMRKHGYFSENLY